LTKEGFEADDIIGTLARKVNGDLGEGEVIIVTGDQDTLQLVDQRTKVAMPAMGKTKETLYDPSAVLGKFGLTPAQIVDFKALSGDSSDNIPGVRGIGEKTATDLLKEFGSIEKIYDSLDNEKKVSKIKERTINLLKEGKEAAFMSKELATIECNVNFDFKLKDSRLHDFDNEKVTEFLDKYRFKSLIRRMPQSKRIEGQQESMF
jgi:DNA polymerase-1